ncbi:DUF6480 family protein [Actinotalea sp. K2]|uniref:DUF6480 family protein n=1 Tax=Actinotalea sp. K2 TaxID=2939438 RepID=UPI002016C8C6|nr:DUF6480 family protein [Actinotalea sp. K2]MCL3862895.1 DUF6480 family protein [Actinotalea sp. K2]
MTSPGTDLDPDQTPGLEPGGSVAPGDTPPAETSTTGGVKREQPDLPSGRTNKVVYGLILGVVALVVLMFVGYAVGLIT